MNNDVAVIGAGPAGAWAAYQLARLGARVIITDPSHPREKPCGGGVTGRALALVGDAFPRGFPAAVRIRSVRFIDTATRRSLAVPLEDGDDPTPLVVATRREFDCALLSAAVSAGAELVAARVVAVARAHGAFRLDGADGITRTARFVIGADGANSLVRRRLATPFQRRQLSIATGFYAWGTTSDEVVIELIANPPGYIWSFPRPDHLAIGICAQADVGATAEQLRARTASWLRSADLAPGARLAAYSWPIPSLPARDLREQVIAGPDWLLAGDAAGLVDPITREGIFFAVQSAAFAADALASGSSRPDRDYADRVRAEIVSELARAARLKARFFHRRFTELLVTALGQSPRVQSVLIDLIAGRQSYRGLRRRLARTFEFGLAWKLLTSR